MSVVPKLFLIAYHLWVPYCQHVPPCSRKTQFTKCHSIKRLENHNCHKCNTKKMAVRKYSGHFQKRRREVASSRPHKSSGIYYITRQVKMIAVNIFFCEEKQKIGLFVYHLEGLRVPLLVYLPWFGNHWLMWPLDKEFGDHCFTLIRKEVAILTLPVMIPWKECLLQETRQFFGFH